MRPSTHRPFSVSQTTSIGTADTKTVTLGANTSAILLSVETTAARVTFDGSTPDATHGHVYPAGVAPVFVPVGAAATVKFASTAAANSVVDITELR